ncbi:MAG: DUF1439 domain-containing protein, partial [Burkholderiales bacterium]
MNPLLFSPGHLCRWFALFAFLALTGCTLVPFFDRQLSVPYTDLNERIAQRFPMERNIADLLTVTLTRPVVTPVLANAARGQEAAAARLSVMVDVQVKLPSLLNNSQRSLWGSMTLSGKPRYDSKSKAVMLVEANLDRVRVDNMPDALSALLAKAASQLAKEYLDDKPIYALNAAQVGRLGLDA